MTIFAETQRLILRELLPSDDAGMYELDSDPEVHRYLGNNPIDSIEKCREVIDFVRQQYVENGIGRWAVEDKATGAFMGWAGLKLVKDTINGHTDFYDVGYRLIRKYWGMGVATEATAVALEYGFKHLPTDVIYATVYVDNAASRNVLQKSGLTRVETFEEWDTQVDWFRITRAEWEMDRKLRSA